MGDDWVVDSLVGFLQSPVWKHPVNSFIEQKCVVFDIGDESSFSQTEIHDEYQAIVEKLLEEFTADLGITPEQLAEACAQSSSLAEGHQKVFNELLAAEDFIVFKSMMVQKNIDLELQALTILQKQLGHSPEAYVPSSKSGETETKTSPTHGEDEKILKEVLETSKKDYDLEQSLDEEQLEKLITLAKQESIRLYQAAEKEQQLLTESVDKMSLKVQSASEDESTTSSSVSSMKVELSESVGKVTESMSPPASIELSKPPNITSPSKTSQQVPLQPLVQSPGDKQRDKNEGSSSDAAAMWLESAKAEFSHPSSSTVPSQTKGTKVAVEIPDDLKAREQYLRRQRDRLLEMKRKARAKELDSYTATRPKFSCVIATNSTAKEEDMRDQTQGRPAETKEKEVSGHDVDQLQEKGERKEGRNTGILCSAIAGKMRKEHVQT